MIEDFAAGRGRRLGIDLNGYRRPVNAAGRADVDDLRFGYGAVRHDCEISPPGQNISRAPVHFDDPTVRAALEIDPVTGPVRPAETQHDAGEHVAQGTLQGKTEDYGNSARRRQQTLDREIEDIGDNGKDRGKINETREQVLKQLSSRGLR